MTEVVLLLHDPAWWIGTTFVLGLVVGSFLNVVIHRLPARLQHRWRVECREHLGLAAETDAPPPGLVRPRSHCPRCGHVLRPWENLPLLSYLVLRGRCRACGAPIPRRYLWVELAAGLGAAAVAWHYGPGWAAAGALVFTWALIALAVIDARHYLLPDGITLPLLWLGLLLNLGGLYTPLPAAVLGAAAGYGGLWLVYQAFRLATGKEGMGYGDFKLLAAIGAWAGWQQLPATLLLSAVVGAAFGIAQILLRRRSREHPIPFGPFLAAAGWIALLWGERITGAYLRYAGLY